MQYTKWKPCIDSAMFLGNTIYLYDVQLSNGIILRIFFSISCMVPFLFNTHTFL